MRRILVLAVVVAAGLAVAAPALASPYVRYGIQDDAWLEFGPGTLETRLDRLDATGVDLVRVTLDWSAIERTRGKPDWARSDALLRGLHDRGIEPVVTLYGTPRWANGGRTPNWAPTSAATWSSFVRRTAQRYPFVRRWLVWNEPNQQRWLRPTSPQTYVTKLLNPAYAAIHGVRSSALVGGGVTAPRGSTGGVSPVRWIAGMRAAGARLDAYAHNPYALQPGETPWSGGCDHCETITMATLERLLTSVSRAWGAKRIWLTEYGYQTNPPDRLLGVSKATQARYLAEAALRAYAAPRVDMLVQYLIQDEPDVARWQSGAAVEHRRRQAGVRRVPVPARAGLANRPPDGRCGARSGRAPERRPTACSSTARARGAPSAARSARTRAASSRAPCWPGRARRSASARRRTTRTAPPSSFVSARQRASRSSTEGAFGSRGGRSSRHVQSAGSLSSRQRRSFVPCRNRLPCTLSYRTSTTSSGRTAASSSSPPPQRFGSENRALGRVLEQRQHAVARPPCRRDAATAHEPT